MTEPIVSIAKIKAEALASARLYTDINAACPYPFGTQAANVFKVEFLWARESVLAVEKARKTLNLSEVQS
ncbi:MAG: hypothetical protein Q8R67_05250 [Rhodoferax sp.]|nr:hypothetical protein [Rhodoferax sp.]MDP3651073.1 hypothetical protein [Rhodoferax sp.]